MRADAGPGEGRVDGGGGAGASPRLFFALVPDPAVRAGLAALAREVARAAGGRPPRAGNLHLTLAFLGAVPAGRIAALEALGAAAAAAASPFVLTLDHVGAFRGAGIGWAGARLVPAALRQLVAALAEGLEAAGFPVERRPFHPHVTLSRRGRTAPAGVAVASLAWRVDRIVLMASETRAEGPRYRELAAWPLAAPVAAAGGEA